MTLRSSRREPSRSASCPSRKVGPLRQFPVLGGGERVHRADAADLGFERGQVLLGDQPRGQVGTRSRQRLLLGGIDVAAQALGHVLEAHPQGGGLDGHRRHLLPIGGDGGVEGLAAVLGGGEVAPFAPRLLPQFPLAAAQHLEMAAARLQPPPGPLLRCPPRRSTSPGSTWSDVRSSMRRCTSSRRRSSRRRRSTAVATRLAASSPERRAPSRRTATSSRRRARASQAAWRAASSPSKAAIWGRKRERRSRRDRPASARAARRASSRAQLGGAFRRRPLRSFQGPGQPRAGALRGGDDSAAATASRAAASSAARRAALCRLEARATSTRARSKPTRAASRAAGPAPSGWAARTPKAVTRSPSGVTARRPGWRCTRDQAAAQPSTTTTSPSRAAARAASAAGPSRSTRASTPGLGGDGARRHLAPPGDAAKAAPPRPADLSEDTAPASASGPDTAKASLHGPRAASTAAARFAGTSRRATTGPRTPSCPAACRCASGSPRPATAASSASTRARAAASPRRASARAPRASSRAAASSRARPAAAAGRPRPGPRLLAQPGTSAVRRSTSAAAPATCADHQRPALVEGHRLAFVALRRRLQGRQVASQGGHHPFGGKAALLGQRPFLVLQGQPGGLVALRRHPGGPLLFGGSGDARPQVGSLLLEVASPLAGALQAGPAEPSAARGRPRRCAAGARPPSPGGRRPRCRAPAPRRWSPTACCSSASVCGHRLPSRPRRPQGEAAAPARRRASSAQAAPRPGAGALRPPTAAAPATPLAGRRGARRPGPGGCKGPMRRCCSPSRSCRRCTSTSVASRRRRARSRRRRCLVTPAASSMTARCSSGPALSTASTRPWPTMTCWWRPTPLSDSISWMSRSRQSAPLISYSEVPSR